MARLPNILWILTTQWRAQACGFAGDPNARTPRLDAWAAGAANFTQAVTPHPFGPFARAALLTGVPCPASGVRDYYDPLPADASTIAHALNGRGYVTAYFGKWHLARRDPAAPLVGTLHATMIVPPENRGGFDVWEGFESGFLLNDPWLHGTRLPQPRQFNGYQSDVLCARAADWIEDQSGAGLEPWFCVVSLEPPHPPYSAPAGLFLPSKPDALMLRPNVPHDEAVQRKAREELAGYYAHIAATDAAIGRLLERVDGGTTAVVVTSVHGDMHGSHGKFRKGWPFEESVRVPLLVHLPPSLSVAESVGIRHDLVSLLDLPRWATRWADGGSDALGTVAAQQLSMPSVVQLPLQCDRAWRAVRTRFRKLVLSDSPDTDRVPWLYFDLEQDPFEQTNLANDASRRTEIEALQSLIRMPAPG